MEENKGIVLIVDDEEHNRKLAEDILSDEGHEVLLAENGKECLRLASEQQPNVILLDIMMPGMDGLEVLERLKTDSNLCHIPVIMISALEKKDTIAKCIKGGADDYFVKPFDSTILNARVSSSLEKYRLRKTERDFFQKTFQGSMKIITDILSFSNPIAFGQASRVRLLAQQIALRMEVKKIWELNIAAMLSQIGCITVPTEILEKISRGISLTSTERSIFTEHPRKGHNLIAKLPGLKKIAEIILYQNRHYQGDSSDGPTAEDIPFGARLLHVAIDFDTFTSSGLQSAEALKKVHQHKDYYDPVIVDALSSVVKSSFNQKTHSLKVNGLIQGMVLDQDVYTKSNLLLATKGLEISSSLHTRLKNFDDTVGVLEPIKIIALE